VEDFERSGHDVIAVLSRDLSGEAVEMHEYSSHISLRPAQDAKLAPPEEECRVPGCDAV
jgi:hypothetical protein